MPTNTLTGQDAAVDRAASRRNLGLKLFRVPPLRSRPAADLPANSEVGLKTMPSPVLGNWQAYSLRVCANAQNWVTLPRGPKAEEAPVEPYDHAIDLVGPSTDAPSITMGFLYKLGSDAELLTVLTVNQVVQFDVTFDLFSLDQFKTLPNHLEEGFIGGEEFYPLAFDKRQHVEREAFLHGYQVRLGWHGLSAFWGERAPKVMFKPQFPN